MEASLIAVAISTFVRVVYFINGRSTIDDVRRVIGHCGPSDVTVRSAASGRSSAIHTRAATSVSFLCSWCVLSTRSGQAAQSRSNDCFQCQTAVRAWSHQSTPIRQESRVMWGVGSMAVYFMFVLPAHRLGRRRSNR